MTNPPDTSTAPTAATPHFTLWGTLLWGGLVAIVFILVQSLVAILIVTTGKGYTTPEQFGSAMGAASGDGLVLAWATLATMVVGCGLIAVIIRFKRGAHLADYLAIRTLPWKALVKWLGVLAIFIVAVELLGWVLQRPSVPEFMKIAYLSAQPVALLWLAVVVAAPVFEETFFRGFLHKGLASSRLGAVGASVITAALWALIHMQYDAYDMTIIFLTGLLLSWARVRSGSLLVPIAMHATFNLVAMVQVTLWAVNR